MIHILHSSRHHFDSCCWVCNETTLRTYIKSTSNPVAGVNILVFCLIYIREMFAILDMFRKSLEEKIGFLSSVLGFLPWILGFLSSALVFLSSTLGFLSSILGFCSQLWDFQPQISGKSFGIFHLIILVIWYVCPNIYPWFKLQTRLQSALKGLGLQISALTTF